MPDFNHRHRSVRVPPYGEHHAALHCSQRRKERGVFFFGQSKKFFSKFYFCGVPLAPKIEKRCPKECTHERSSVPNFAGFF